jgi:NAD(P)-dependent dehydrogenase (short-subunit alcohol dehydrogenase family)
MTPDLFSVQGKLVVLTGGLGLLGRQFVLALVERGARVAVMDAALDRKIIAQRFGGRENDPNLMFVTVDVRNADSIRQGLAQIKAKWGAPQGLVNAAAIDAPPDAPASETGPFETYPAESWDKVMDVNVKGVFQCCQVIGGDMAQSGGGSIINIGSIYGIVSPDQRIYAYRRTGGDAFFKPVAYSVSKSALLNLTRYLATYWADKGIRVNTLTFAGAFNNQDPRFLEAYCAKVPLGRMAQAGEYNGAVIFLLSDASSYMTGSNMILDGGLTAW